MLSRKEIKNEAIELALQRKQKSEIYSALREKIDKRDSAYLSSIILSCTGEEIKGKFRPHALILMLIFSLAMIFWFYTSQTNTGDGRRYFSLIAVILSTGLFNVSLYKLEHQALTALLLIGAMSFVVLVLSAIPGKYANNYYISVIPLIIGLYSYWIRTKVYPELTLTGSVKKDKAGNHEFSEKGGS